MSLSKAENISVIFCKKYVILRIKNIKANANHDLWFVNLKAL